MFLIWISDSKTILNYKASKKSIPECKETILYIETYLHEFTELKKLLELKREHDFDNNNGKCKGISWEIRKTSPGPRRQASESDK